MGEKKKRDTFTLILYTSWVWRTPVLVKEARRPAQQASNPFVATEVGLRVELGYPL